MLFTASQIQYYLRSCAPVVQLDRTSVFGTEGWGFESLRVYFSAFGGPSVLLFSIAVDGTKVFNLFVDPF